jgi:hypothetical protein
MSLHTAAPEAEDWAGHAGSLDGGLTVQAACVIVHWPGVTCVGQLRALVHTSPVILHVPGTVGHWAVLVQGSVVIEHCWFWIGQVALDVHVPPVLLQVPESVGQLAPVVQLRPELEHVPGTTGHCALLAQTVGLIEHWPERPQLASTVQACPLRLQPPAMVGHCAPLVHTALLTLQRPLASGHSPGSTPRV